MARRRDFFPPVEAVDGGWRIGFDAEERSLLIRLMEELGDLLSGPGDNDLVQRLFPAAYPEDEEKEAEYQRLMREELVASRLSAIETVKEVLDPERTGLLDEGQTIAFMQSVNAVRLVLGTMLDITDDETADEADDSDTPEHQLYDFLSWILEWTVQSLSTTM
jgi:Domain of unknown function (DUF2017)